MYRKAIVHCPQHTDMPWGMAVTLHAGTALGLQECSPRWSPASPSSVEPSSKAGASKLFSKAQVTNTLVSATAVTCLATAPHCSSSHNLLAVSMTVFQGPSGDADMGPYPDLHMSDECDASARHNGTALSFQYSRLRQEEVAETQQPSGPASKLSSISNTPKNPFYFFSHLNV